MAIGFLKLGAKFIAQPQVQREMGQHPEVILHVKSQDRMFERPMRENIGLPVHARRADGAGRARQEPSQVREENPTSREVRVQGGIVVTVDESAELERVPALRVKQIVAVDPGILLILVRVEGGWPPLGEAGDVDLTDSLEDGELIVSHESGLRPEDLKADSVSQIEH